MVSYSGRVTLRSAGELACFVSIVYQYVFSLLPPPGATVVYPPLRITRSNFPALDVGIHCRRVMVLERGNLMEYAPPLELLNDPNSLFYALCKKTGALEELKETARVEQEGKVSREGGTGGDGDAVLPPLPPSEGDNEGAGEGAP